MLLLAVLSVGVTVCSVAGHQPSFVAAVYEHHPVLNPEPRVPVSRSDALRHMHRNLDVYEEQASVAAGQVRGRPEVRLRLRMFETF